MLHRLSCLLFGLSGSFLACNAVLPMKPSVAAQNVAFKYGPITRSIPVADVRAYADRGETSSELKSLLSRLGSENRTTVQSALQIKLPLDVVAVDRLVRADYGKQALTQVAEVIERGDDAGIQALRAGLVLGAASPRGLGVISFLEAYPSNTVTIDLPKALAFVKQNDQLLKRLPEVLPQGR